MKKLITLAILALALCSCEPAEPLKFQEGDFVMVRNDSNKIYEIRMVKFAGSPFSSETRTYKMWCRHVYTGSYTYYQQSELTAFKGRVFIHPVPHHQ